MYVKINNDEVQKYPYTIDELRGDNPNTSFPKNPSEEILNSFGVYSVGFQAQPDYDSSAQRVDHSLKPELIDGKWIITKTVVDLTDEQIEANQARLYLDAANQVRRKRDMLLEATDWYGLSDVTMPAEIASYRQALRDISAQDGFPHNIIWPEKPV